ncbi:hypothetical protein Tco_1544719 [Tanacetum coccineum]
MDKILNTHNAGDSGQARTPIDTRTRPDLAYAVSRLSRYTSNPSYAHWKAIMRVLHYLRYSRDYGLHYDRHPAVIEGYSDANWISDLLCFVICYEVIIGILQLDLWIFINNCILYV